MMYALHGAGVENNSPFWAEDAYRDSDEFKAYIVQPSGVTSWGDDWHGAWSFKDVESAREGLIHWASSVVSCFPSSFHLYFYNAAIVAGHSNGGGL